MNLAHVHLLLNHVPVLGTVFGLALLVYALWKRDDRLQRVAFGTFVVVALLALPAYFTGEPAEEAVAGAPGVTEQVVDVHEEAALVSLIGVELLGVIALGGLLVARGGRPLAAGVTRVALLVALATAGLSARTANLGGQIRHPEIRAGAQPAPAAEGEGEGEGAQESDDGH